MKSKSIYISVFMCMAIMLMATDLLAQKKDRTRVRAYYEKLANDNLQIRVILTSGSGKNMVGIPGADIELANVAGEEEQPLAVIQTNQDGEGILQIEYGFALDRDEEGYAIVNASFAGNDSLRSSSRKVKFKDLKLELAFNEEDSIKILKVFAFEDSSGVKLPIEELGVNIGVQRLLSVLTLESVETDEEGIAEYEFPLDVPGDEVGSLDIVVSIIEDRNYGTMTRESEINWGTIVDYTSPGNGRSLFGDEAPLWMIIAIFIVLGGAWFHFIWAIMKVWSIKKLGESSD